MGPGRKLVPRGLAALVLVSFILPFVSVTCAGETVVSLTGAHLAAGIDLEVEDPFTGETQRSEVDPEPFALAAGVLAALLATLALLARGGRWSIVVAAAGALALLLLRVDLNADIEEVEASGFGATYGAGWWLAVAGFVGSAAYHALAGRSEAGVPAVAETRTAAERAPPAADPPPGVVAEAQCRACGVTLAPEAAFCTRCGVAVPTPQACVNCDAALEPDQAFCTRCGVARAVS